MRIRPVATAVLVATLMGSVAGPAVAQENAASADPSGFLIDFTSSEIISFEENTALSQHQMKAPDPRATGELTVAATIGGDMLRRSYNVFTQNVRLTNDLGSWTGTGRGVSAIVAPAKGKKGKKREAAPKTESVDIYELSGEDAYEGLTLLMVRRDNQWWGLIVPDETVPPAPDLAGDSGTPTT